MYDDDDSKGYKIDCHHGAARSIIHVLGTDYFVWPCGCLSPVYGGKVEYACPECNDE